ncbi:hypothetical protein H0H93_001343 [Arthromyces matolae]|nr:hypothetical protein H0H93_001343 [Arthromyces matolae]
MTAVLQAADPLHKDRHTMSLDDNQISPPFSNDLQVAEMLAETRAELDDFHHASKELEAELENELQRTEKAQQVLKVKAIRAESERDEWKGKFMSLQTNHNTTTASLQRELDKLRQELQQAKVQLRDLEMGNDDLERNERAVSSSLADMEAKYSRALEEKILLEHELLEKANLEEESQRLRDELRDASVEVSILKDQIANLQEQMTKPLVQPSVSQESQTAFSRASTRSEEDLLSTAPPPDLEFGQLSPSTDSLSSDGAPLQSTPKAVTAANQSAARQRAGFEMNKSRIASPPSHPRVTRSTTLPSLYMSSPHTPTLRPARTTNTSTSTTSTITSKSRGVQMVSEMRARVRNLEQKIHTRVPRLRMGSITAKTNPNSVTYAGPMPTTGSSGASSTKSVAKSTWESITYRRSVESARSNDSGSDKNQKDNGGDSSGWVLIMEDSPPSLKGREKRRVISASPSHSHVPSSFRPAASTALKSPTSVQSPIGGTRRPQSRLSAGSLSTTTTSSIPTPVSRPATPTFLPLPTTGPYSSNAGTTGPKLSTGPGTPNLYNQNKRSSLGASSAMLSLEGVADRLSTLPPRPTSGTPSSGTKYQEGKALPQLPGLNTNITMRHGQMKLPPSTQTQTTPMLAQSRIGRPASGRKSADGTLKPLRIRSGSMVEPTS